jgi:hypothetical protein
LRTRFAIAAASLVFFAPASQIDEFFYRRLTSSSQTETPAARAVSPVTAPSERADEIFLEGPRSRFEEFITLLKVMRDFLRGFRTLHFVGPCVTVFGSARIKREDPNYELARKMGAAIRATRVHSHDRWWAWNHGSG